MALTIGELVGYLRVDSRRFNTGLSRAESALVGFSRDADGRLRDLSGRFAAEGLAAGAGFARGLRKGAGSFAQLGKSVGAVTALAGAAGAATNSLSALGSGLVTTSGALLLLPGAAVAGGAAMTALAVGTRGFGDALSSMNDPAEFAEALSSLAPSARSSAVALRELAPAWALVQQATQQELFAGGAGAIRNLAEAYLPSLGAGLSGIAGGFNQAAHSAAAFLVQAQTIRDVESILGATSAAFSRLGAILRPVLQAFRDIAVVGAGFLPQLAASAGAAAQSFATFIATARQTGQLASWIQGGLTALASLGRIARNVASSIGAVFAAASGGGSSLAALEQLTARLSGFLNSAQGASALGQIFAGLRAAAAGLVPALGQLAQILLSSLAPMFARLGPLAGQLAALLGGALGTAVQIVSTAFSPLVSMLARLGGLMSENAGAVSYLASVLGGAAVAIGTIMAVSRAWVAVQWALNAAMSANPIGIVVVALGALVGAIVWAWNNLDWFRNFWTTVWNGLVTAAQPLINYLTTQVVPRLQAIWSQVMAGLNQFVAWFQQAWRSGLGDTVLRILGVIGAGIQAHWSTFVTVIQAAMQVIGGIVSGAWQMISGVISGALTFIQGLIRFFTGILTGDWGQAWRGIQQMTAGITRAIRGVINGFLTQARGVINGGLTLVRGLFTAAWNYLQSITSGAFGRLVSTIGTKITEAVAFVKSLPGRARTALGNLAGLLVNAGVDLVSGMVNGIRSYGAQIAKTLLGFAREAWARIKSFFGISSPSKLMMGAGVNIGQGLAIGIASTAGMVDRAFADMATTPRLPATVLPAPRLATPVATPRVAAPTAVAYRPPVPGDVPGAEEASPVGSNRASVHIDQFHTTPRQTPADIARELDWLSRGRGW